MSWLDPSVEPMISSGGAPKRSSLRWVSNAGKLASGCPPARRLQQCRHFPGSPFPFSLDIYGGRGSLSIPEPPQVLFVERFRPSSSAGTCLRGAAVISFAPPIPVLLGRGLPSLFTLDASHLWVHRGNSSHYHLVQALESHRPAHSHSSPLKYFAVAQGHADKEIQAGSSESVAGAPATGPARITCALAYATCLVGGPNLGKSWQLPSADAGVV